MHVYIVKYSEKYIESKNSKKSIHMLKLYTIRTLKKNLKIVLWNKKTYYRKISCQQKNNISENVEIAKYSKEVFMK